MLLVGHEARACAVSYELCWFLRYVAFQNEPSGKAPLSIVFVVTCIVTLNEDLWTQRRAGEGMSECSSKAFNGEVCIARQKRS